MDALEHAIEIAGGEPGASPKALADLLGVTAMAVHQWRKRGIPPARARDIEIALEGQVTRAQLRPDLFGDASSIDSPAAIRDSA